MRRLAVAAVLFLLGAALVAYPVALMVASVAGRFHGATQ